MSEQLSLIRFALALAVIAWVPWMDRIAHGRRPRAQSQLFYGSLLCGAFSLCFAVQSVPAIVLALVSFAGCLVYAFISIFKAMTWGLDHLGSLLSALAAVFLAGGSIWLFSTRLQSTFLHFGEPAKTLTAIHFHYTGFLFMTVFAGHWQVLKLSRPRLAKLLAFSSLLYVMGFVLVAIGLNGIRAAEIIGTPLLVACLGVNLFLILSFYFKQSRLRFVVVLIGVVSGVSFGLAVCYSLRFSNLLSLPIMIASHGILNAFVLVPAFLLLLTGRLPKIPEREILFSRLTSKWGVGANFFASYIAATQNQKGLLGKFSEFNRADFRSDHVDPLVQNFYEDTLSHELHVKSHPSIWFSLIWRFLAKPFFSSIEQLDLPDHDQAMRGRIQALRPECDGRGNVRAWIRTDKLTGQGIYSAAYSMQTKLDITYMNIAFPLPRCNLTSILFVEYLKERPGGIRLTTLPAAHFLGDQGVYLASKGLCVRLPLNEIIDVWSEGQTLRARHVLWFFGIRYLTLDYQIQKF